MRGEKLVPTEAAMTVREVATYLNVDEKTVYRLAQRGELPGFKVAGTWRFKRGDIDRWIEERKIAAIGREVHSAARDRKASR
jgi:excisionase family DNA binding protein